MNFQE